MFSADRRPTHRWWESWPSAVAGRVGRGRSREPVRSSCSGNLPHGTRPLGDGPSPNVHRCACPCCHRLRRWPSWQSAFSQGPCHPESTSDREVDPGTPSGIGVIGLHVRHSCPDLSGSSRTGVARDAGTVQDFPRRASGARDRDEGCAPRKSRPSGAAMPQTSGWGAGEVAINTAPPAWHRQCSFEWRAGWPTTQSLDGRRRRA